jgi:hypothetical protein
MAFSISLICFKGGPAQPMMREIPMEKRKIIKRKLFIRERSIANNLLVSKREIVNLLDLSG